MVRSPDFLIIGAQKCGTTWLHHQLRLADRVYMPEDKDFEHFSYVGNLNSAAFEAYCRRFSEAGAHQLAGDSNAAYFWTRTGSRWGRQPDSFNPDIPGSIREFCGPDLKLILILRHPVERAVSAYLHHIRYGAITPDDSVLDPALPLGIVDMGLFRVHLLNWLEVYPREQLHLIPRLPEGEQATVRTIEAVCDFLGVAPPPGESHLLEPVFPGLQRVTDDSGVWVIEPEEDDRAIPFGDRPVRSIGAARYRRVITAEELNTLHSILDPHAIG